MSGNAQSIRAGKAFVELFADNTKLAKGLKEAKKYVNDFGNSLKDVGTKMFAGGSAIVAPLVTAAHIYQSMGDAVGNAASRTGMTAEAFSALAFAANQADVEVEAFEGGIRKMQKTIGAAAMGSKSSAEGIQALGLSVADLKAMSPDKQFLAIADRIARIEDPAVRAAMAMGIFGRGGAALLPMMQDGALGINEMMAEAERLGLVISTQDAEAASKFEETLKKLWATLKKAAFDIGSAVVPVLQGLAGRIISVTANVSQWIKTHKELIREVLVGAAIVAGLGAAFIVVGVAIKFVAKAIGAVLGVLSFLKTVFGMIRAAVTFLLTPLGMVVGAIAGIIAIAYKLGAFDRAIQSVKASMAALADETRTTFGAIAQAVKGGNIMAAVKVLWSYVKMEWKAGTNWLMGIWDWFTFALRKAFSVAGYGIIETGKVVWNALQDGWDALVFVMCQAWNGFSTGIAVVWEEIKASAAKAWNYVRALWSDIDVGQANQAIEDEKNAAVAALENKSGQAYLDHEAENAARSQQRENELQMMIDEDNRAYADLQREQDARAKARADELAQATKEWKDAVAAAKAADKNAVPKAVKSAIPSSAQTQAAIAAIAKLDVRGTFNAFALASLNAANISTAEKTANATAETARNTRKLTEQIAEMDENSFT